jgi:hypothetical protein
MIKLGKRGGESIQGYRCHRIRSMKRRVAPRVEANVNSFLTITKFMEFI